MRLNNSFSLRRAICCFGICASAASFAVRETSSAGTFGEDVQFLQQHTDLIVLSDAAGRAKVAVSPRLQGRVLTSTTQGDRGDSFGWINREVIAAHTIQPHINVYGGEDRFWMGPEGGQFSIFFSRGTPFDLEHWFTPAPLDTEPFELRHRSETKAELQRSFSLTNYSGTQFDIEVDRTVQLLSSDAVWQHLHLAPVGEVQVVGFETINRLRNRGSQPWKKDTGLLSIWILGMFNPSPDTTIAIPIQEGSEAHLGPAVTSDYFGPVPSNRVAVKDGVVFFSGDGKFRSKIGIGPRRAKGVLGSYDAGRHVLSLIQFAVPAGETNYVNSLWQIQSQPYAGDAANSYNDGPPAPGAKPLGPFYEMETSSPALALAPGQSSAHLHRTIHLSGPEPALDRVSRSALGVSLRSITTALPKTGTDGP